MLKHFFSHYWKSVFRNASWRRNIISKVVFGILVLYLIMLFIYIGTSLPELLSKKEGDPVNTFNSFLLWYFLIDLLVRTMMQSLPVIQVVPYLRFKFRKSVVVHYLLIKSVWNIFNFLPWLIVIPFCAGIVPENISCFHYLAGILFMLLINNFLALYFQYISQKNFFFSVIPLILVGLNFFLQQNGDISSQLSQRLGSGLLSGNPVIFAALAAMLALVYYLIRILLTNGFYLDEVKSKKSSEDRFARLPGMEIFSRLGITGKYMALEANLLLRNKRPRQALVMLPIFWTYLVYVMIRDADKLTTGIMGVYFISIVVGMAAIMYGQFLFSWESSYFDGLMARRNDFRRYVLAKYYIMSLLVSISFIPLYIAMVLVVKVSPLILISLTLFVLGPIQFIIFFFGIFNDARVDLAGGQFFNYQGVKGKHFLVSFAFFLIPFFLYMLLNYLIGSTPALLIIAGIGLLFIVFHKYWLTQIIMKKFLTRKYKNLEGFRKLTA
jgi:hypothetical protein